MRGPVAFVLSGGANLGAAQAGMLEALLDAGIVPDLLVGTSIGAVNASYMAAGPTPAQAGRLSDIWRGLSAAEFFPLRPVRTTRAVLEGAALFSPEPLRRLLERELPYRQIEEAPTGLSIVATRCEGVPAGSLKNLVARLDARGGQAAVPLRLAASRLEETVERAAVPLRLVALGVKGHTEEVFSSGPVIDAVLASSALPLVYPPYRFGGHVYVDGGLSEYLPLRPALEAGARTVFLMSLGGNGPSGALAGPWGGWAGSIRNRVWQRLGLTSPDLGTDFPDADLVALPVPQIRIGLRDFSRLQDLITRAREDAVRFLDAEVA